MGRFKRKQARRLRKMRRQMCPACLDRDALNLVGRPRNDRGFKMTGGCELCKGSGEIMAGLRDGDKGYDPWVVVSLDAKRKAKEEAA